MLRSTTKTCVILLFLMAAMALHALALADGDAYSYLPENVHDDDPSKGFLLLDSLHLVKGSVLLAMQASQLVIHYLLEQRTAPVIISAHLRHGLGSIQPGATFGWTVHGGFESNTDGVLEVTVHIAPPQGCPAAVTTVVVHGRKDMRLSCGRTLLSLMDLPCSMTRWRETFC